MTIKHEARSNGTTMHCSTGSITPPTNTTPKTSQQSASRRVATATSVFLSLAIGCSETAPTLDDTHGSALSSSTGGVQSAGTLDSQPRFANVVGGEEREIDPTTGQVLASTQFVPTAAELSAVEKALAEQRHGSSLGRDAIVIRSGLYWNGQTLEQNKYVTRVTPGTIAEADVPANKAQEESVPTPVETSDVLSSALRAALADAGDSDKLPLYVLLKERPKSKLAKRVNLREYIGFAGSNEVTSAEHLNIDTRISERKAEVEQIQAPTRDYLRQLGVADSEVGSLWLTGAIATKLEPAKIRELSSFPAIRGIFLDRPTPGSTANTWDGTNLQNGGSDGLNVGLYRDGGYLGDGNGLTIGFIGDGFELSHAAFDDWASGPSRWIHAFDCVHAWNLFGYWFCPELTTNLTGDHETAVASAAAADLLQIQVPGTLSFRLDRTGVAREADMYAVEGTSIAEATAGLEELLRVGVDVVNISRGDHDDYCNYDSEVDAWSETAWEAHEAGMLIVVSAGNTHPSGCSITKWAQAPSVFTVGAVSDPIDNGYPTADIWIDPGNGTASAWGGMGAGVRNTSGTYTWRSGVLSAVDAVTPVRFNHAATIGGTFGGASGTSIAAPQVAGSALLIKDAFLTNGGTYLNEPGVLFLTLLSMTDRANSQTTYRTGGFNNGWGGGRFQLRYFWSGADHPLSGAWGHDLWETTIYQGQTLDFPIRGTGAEPADLQQFKVYAMFFEDGWQQVADIDIQVRDQNCGPTSNLLGEDSSYDVKSMVRLNGTAAAGRALCVRVMGYAVPPEGRRVVLASYFSRDTSMR
jgi:Subtilase family